MNIETGEIISEEELSTKQDKSKYKILPITTYVRAGDKVGRNDPCPCMSGKKFKRCCLEVKQAAEREINKIPKLRIQDLS